MTVLQIFHRAVVPAAVGTAVSVVLYYAMSRRGYSLGKRVMVPAGVGTILGETITIKRLRDDYAGWKNGLTDEPAMREVLRELMYASKCNYPLQIHQSLDTDVL